jgi:hypothetical protein
MRFHSITSRNSDFKIVKQELMEKRDGVWIGIFGNLVQPRNFLIKLLNGVYSMQPVNQVMNESVMKCQ